MGIWAGRDAGRRCRSSSSSRISTSVERPTAPRLLHVVPPVVLALAKHPLGRRAQLFVDPEALLWRRAARCRRHRQCTRRLGCVLFRQGYGLTETSPAAALTSTDDVAKAKPGSIGSPVANTECRVVDVETRSETSRLPVRTARSWIRGPQVMRGYFNRPRAETRATIDEEGWLHTGDIGHARTPTATSSWSIG